MSLSTALRNMPAAVTAGQTCGACLLELELGYNGLGPDDGVGWGEWMAGSVAMESPIGLRLLSLHDNPLGESGGMGLAAGLGLSPPLLCLALSDCRLGDGAGSALASALTRNTRLRVLDLEGNKLGPASALALGEALGQQIVRGQQQPGGLDKLILSGNRLGDTGVSSLAGALSRAQAAVAKARSADSNPSDEGASSGAALSQDVQNAAAAPYRGLSSLLLRSVEMGACGAHAIGTAIIAPATNPLPGDDLSGRRPTASQERRVSVCSVTELDLSENAFGREGAAALLMRLRIRGLMLGLGRLAHCDPHGGGRLAVTLQGCEMPQQLCTDITAALRPFGGGGASQGHQASGSGMQVHDTAVLLSGSVD